MSNISTKELSAIDDQLSYEAMLVKKYRSFSTQCTDPVLKSMCNQIADRHQQHFNKLLTYLY